VRTGEKPLNILWIILIGLVAGIIARWIAPGPNKPSDFIFTTVLGIGGAFFATSFFLKQQPSLPANGRD
jgi:uncharacterized membrane protein YeaQ/YmgE (transglycosylase-associated protein family)